MTHLEALPRSDSRSKCTLYAVRSEFYSHSRLAFGVLAATLIFLTSLMLIVALTAVGESRRNVNVDQQTNNLQFRGSTRGGAPAPANLKLKDQNGARYSLSSRRGQVTIVTFIYTNCKDICPTSARIIASAFDKLDSSLARQTRAALVSVDPANDTEKTAKRFLKANLLEGRGDYLLGTASELAASWKGFAVQPQLENIEHTAVVIVLDRELRQQASWPVSKLSSAGLAADIATVANLR